MKKEYYTTQYIKRETHTQKHRERERDKPYYTTIQTE